MPSSTKSSYAFTPTGATGGAVTPPESAAEQAKVAPAAFNRYNSWLDNSKPASEAASELSSPVSVTTTSSAAVVASRLEELKERSANLAYVGDCGTAKFWKLRFSGGQTPKTTP